MNERFESWLDVVEQAERDQGWQNYCLSRELFVVPNEEFVDALAQAIGSEGVVEVAAGAGVLSGCLRRRGVRLIATDPAPRGAGVAAMHAAETLKQYAPRVVLCCFPPEDAGVDRAVFSCRSVEKFFYIGPLIWGGLAPSLSSNPDVWTEHALEDVNRFLISRLDYLPDFTRGTWKQGARAACFVRRSRVQ